MAKINGRPHQTISGEGMNGRSCCIAVFLGCRSGVYSGRFDNGSCSVSGSRDWGSAGAGKVDTSESVIDDVMWFLLLKHIRKTDLLEPAFHQV